MPINILYIDHYAGSRLHGRSYRPHDLGECWVQQGHQVTVVGARYSHLRHHQPSSCQDNIDGISYHWLATPHYQGNGVRRLLSMLVFVAKLFRHLPGLRPKPHVIIASSVYMLDILPAWLLARQTGAKLIFELHDLWPMSPQYLGPMPPWHPFILLMRLAEKMAYTLCDHVVSILPHTYPHVASFGIQPSCFTVIPNGIVPNQWSTDAQLPSELITWIHSQRQAGHLLVAYTGSHSVANALSELIEAFTQLPNQPISLLLLGHGPTKTDLVRQAQGLKHVFFHTSIPKTHMPTLYQTVDALYVGMQHQPMYQYGICPNKIIDYMMAGKPIVAMLTARNNPIEDADCGFSCPAHDVPGLIGCFQALLQTSPEQRQAMGARGQAYVLEHHDYRLLAERYVRAITGEAQATVPGAP